MGTIAEYVDRYRGRRFVIVGKGPTPFQYENLSHVRDPIAFINDAVQFERHCYRSPETFFFAHDQCQATWLTSDLRSTAVLPRTRIPPQSHRMDVHNTRLFADEHGGRVHALKSVITYEFGGRDDAVLDLSRDELASDGRLYHKGGTIHSAIHFAWLCGASDIVFIGCDGQNGPYDDRIDLRSQGPNLQAHAHIRRIQDAMCRKLEIDTIYARTSSVPNVIPRLAHAVWFGSQPPDFVIQAVSLFQKHNPKWIVKLWTHMPADMPAPLQRALRGSQQICQQADIMYLWLLYSRGGVVFDTDSITLRSFEPLRRRGEAWTTWHHGGHKRLTNGVMGSVVHSNAFARAVVKADNEHQRMTEGKREWGRCMYGPNMLTELFTHHGDADMSLLPWHYFYAWPYVERETARAFAACTDQAKRVELLDSIADRFIDGEPPYAVHLWGVDGSSQRQVNSNEV